MSLRSFGAPELLIILVVVLFLFGVGRIGKIAKELDGGIRSFKDGLQGNNEKVVEKKQRMTQRAKRITSVLQFTQNR